MWVIGMAEVEDMTVTGTADTTMTGGEEDMTITGMADMTMAEEEGDMTVTGKADMTMAENENTTQEDNSYQYHHRRLLCRRKGQPSQIVFVTAPNVKQ